MIKIVGDGDSSKELFPLKMRDAAQAAGFAYIKSKGLIPEEDSDDYIPVSAAARGLDASAGPGHAAVMCAVCWWRRIGFLSSVFVMLLLVFACWFFSSVSVGVDDQISNLSSLQLVATALLPVVRTTMTVTEPTLT